MTATDTLDAAARLDDVERETIWQHGWTTGRDAALDARPPRTVWAPLPITWGVVCAGDSFLGEGDTVWHVNDVRHRPTGEVAVVAACGAAVFEVDVPGDESVEVLFPISERDACTLLADELGARMIERRRGQGGDVTR